MENGEQPSWLFRSSGFQPESGEKTNLGRQDARFPRQAGSPILPLFIQPLILILALIFSLVSNESRAAETPRVIGIEGNASVMLARDDYQPKPLDDRTPLILRIEAVTPAGDGRFNYDFHYIGFEPGTYDLGDYLILPDGSPAAEAGGVMIDVRSILPADHDGSLNPYLKRPFPWFGGYRMMLAALVLLWVLGLAGFYWFGRRRKPAVVVEPVVPPPSFAERMRPLVEAAAAGTLAVAGQAELERLMTGYWRDKLALPDARMADTLAALKRHPDAGALLLALERWLHRPGGATRPEIERLLEPYRHLPVPAGKEDAP
jgi:hypothetical protein